MTHRTLKRFVLGASLAVGLALYAGSAPAQEQRPAAPPLDDKPAEQAFKNIQVLKGMPASKLIPAMRFMSASLNVDCDFCHVRPFESDEKQEKQTARMMLRMTADINKTNFNGEQEITCYTCHHGREHPLSAATFTVDPGPSPVPAPEGAEGAAPPKPPALPTVDAIAEKYAAALGGRDAIGKLTTRTGKAAEVGSDGSRSTVEIWGKAPNKVYGVTRNGAPENLSYTQWYNGSLGWGTMQRPGGPGQTRPLRDLEMAAARRDAEFFPALDFKSYEKIAVRRVERFNGRDAYLVVGTAPDGLRERLHFDVETGLLVRRSVEVPTYLGPLAFSYEYSDYRPVNGVKVPFVIRAVMPTDSYTDTYSEVKFNVPVDDAVFAAPPPQPQRPGGQGPGGGGAPPPSGGTPPAQPTKP